MPGIHTRSQKSKAAPKLAVRAAAAAGKPKQGNFEPPPGPGPAISAQEREMLIARAAYFRAERRDFAPGCELQDWVEAEAEVLQLIGGA
jgi:hypothetical protein